jgi:threonine dehydratase
VSVKAAALTTPGAAHLFNGVVDSEISVERIQEAARVIGAAFLNSPQFESEPLSQRLGAASVLKVETINPIRSFKGRGTDYLLYRLGDSLSGIVCASAGNFGQGMAYACRKRDVPLTVFASHTANRLKIERMRALGARIELEVGDFDQAKDAARRHAASTGELFVEDGLIGAIAEGAGTIGIELTRADRLDAVFVPLGNGALVNGVGTWLRHHSPRTRVIAVCAEGAPSMALSWRAQMPIPAPTDTIADGISVRVPVPEAVRLTATTVDDVMLVGDDEMREAMRALFRDAGLLVEPAGAAGVAAIKKRSAELQGARVATILTGGNLTDEQIREWIY